MLVMVSMDMDVKKLVKGVSVLSKVRVEDSVSEVVRETVSVVVKVELKVKERE
jgi:hypothetical protein